MNKTTKGKVKTKDTIDVVINDGMVINKETGEPIDVSKVMKRKEIKIVGSNGESELATGIAINTYDKSSVDYLRAIKDYTEPADDIKKQIKLSNKLFKFEGVVSTGLEILIDFTFSKFSIEIPEDRKEELKPVFDHLVKNLNKGLESPTDYGMSSLAKEIPLDWFVSGNDILYESWKNVGIEDKSYTLPMIIQLMNPNYVTIDEVISGNKVKLKYKYSPNTDSGKDSTRTGIRNRADKNSGNTNSYSQLLNETILKPSRTYHIKRKARQYDIWGIPYLTKVFSVVAAKLKIRALDNSTTEGMINYLTIFKIGSSDVKSKYHIVPSKRLQDFASLVENPQASTTMVWAHDVEVITAGPDGKILDFENKYVAVDKDIIKAMGIPEILIDGSGNATTGWVAILALVERLERVREDISAYFEYIFDKIIERNKIDPVEVKFKWMPTNLRDEKTIKTLLLGYHDRGLLPIRTTLIEGGYNPEEMIEGLKFEQDTGLDKLVKRRDIPFSPVENVNVDDEGGRPEEQEGQPSSPSTSTSVGNIYSEKIKDLYFEYTNKIKENFELVDSGLMMMKSRMDQFIKAMTDSQLGTTDVISTKVLVWNGKYLDRFFNRFKTELGTDLDSVVNEEIFDKFEKRLDLFIKESIKAIEFGTQLIALKEQGYVGAFIRINKDSKCDSCRSLDGNWYVLSELLDRLPIHPNQGIDIEATQKNMVLEGLVLNTPVRVCTIKIFQKYFNDNNFKK